MKKYILAINEGHETSVLLGNLEGKILYAAEEERIVRNKHTGGLPLKTIQHALKYNFINPEQIQVVLFSSKNLITRNYKQRKEKFLDTINNSQFYANKKDNIIIKLKKFIKNILPKKNNVKDDLKFQEYCKILKCEGLINAEFLRLNHHHYNHAASAYYGLRENEIDEYLVFTLDAGGDSDCAHIYKVKKNKFELISKTSLKDSIGSLYGLVTTYLGMNKNEHEYKVMGLGGYSNSKHNEEIYQSLKNYLDLDPKDNMKFKRKTDEPIYLIMHRLQKDFKFKKQEDIAGGLQRFTEDIMVRWIQSAVKKTKINKVLCAGGVFMNISANGKIAKIDELKYFDVFPSCGDASLPFGSYFDYCIRNGKKLINSGDNFNIYLGDNISDNLDDYLKTCSDYKIIKLDDTAKEVAKLLAEGKIVAHCYGKMEFGARALGNRSILADPQDLRIVQKINKMIKKRDFYMPFAPAVLSIDAHKYLEVPETLPKKRISPWMMHAFDTKENRNEFYSGVHSHTHTARAQIVSETFNKRLYDIICEFKKITGRSIILNTSFNLHGYPIAKDAKDAIFILENSGLQHLILEDYLIEKKN